MEQTEIQTDEVRKVSKIPDTKNRMFYPEEITAKGLTPKEVADPYIQKKSIELSEESVTEPNEKRNYIIKDDDGNQIQKETYVQNGEQSDNSIWQRIKRDTDN